MRPLPSTPAQIESWLAASEVFGELDASARAALAPELPAVVLPARQPLFEQGEVAHALYVVAEGLLEVVAREGELSRRVAVLPPGSIFGESALLQGGVRNAGVRALRDSVVLVLEEADLHSAMRRSPEAVLGLVRLVASRRGGSGVSRPTSTVISIAPLSDPDAALVIGERLASAARARGRAVQLITQPPEGQCEPEDAARWLGALATEPGSLTLLVASAQAEPWTALAARNADRVLLAVSEGDTPPSGAVQHPLLHEGISPLLVLPARGRDSLLAWASAIPDGALAVLGEGDEDSLLEEAERGLGALDWLRRSGLFDDLPDSELGAAAARFHWERVEAGGTLFEAGDPARSLYIVVTGRLVVEVERDGELTQLAVLGPGEIVGEMGLFRDAGRTASVRAQRDTVVARLGREDFDAIAGTCPALARRLPRIIIERLRPSRADRPSPLPSVIVLLSVDPLDSLLHLAGQLAEGLTPLGRSTVVDAQRVDALLGAGAAQLAAGQLGEGTLMHWLGRQEEEHQHLILVADHAASNWTRRCLRQADHVLLVASAATTPELRTLELELWGAALPGSVSKVSLLLLQPDWARNGQNTSAWLELRDLDRWYHVRPGLPEDWARLARLVTSRGIGLALSGGGSRGAAHLGVLRGLQEHGVPIDAVSGTSAGAAIAGLVARQLDLPECERHVQGLLGGGAGHFATVGPPYVSLMSGRHVKRLLAPWFAELDIEDLFVPLRIAAVDVSQGRLASIGRGPVWKAVRASTSVPGLWPPVVREGHLHVDGGVLNNLPADLLEDSCRYGRIIASDVGGLEGNRALFEADADAAVSGWRVLLERFVPSLRRRRPGLGSTLVRTMLLANARHMEEVVREHADLLVTVPLKGLGMFDIRTPHAISGAAEQGYRATLSQLEAFDWTGEAPDSEAD